jgi:hypothetical protein
MSDVDRSLVAMAHRIAAEPRGRVHPRPLAVATPSLKDALRRRPGEPEGQSVRTGPSSRLYMDWQRLNDSTRAFLHNSNPKNKVQAEPVVICRPMWTAAQYRTYERLTAMVCSPVISERARAQVWLRKFEEKNGKELCGMLLAEIRRRDADEWFKDKNRTRGA